VKNETTATARYANNPEIQASGACRSPNDAELGAANRELTGEDGNDDGAHRKFFLFSNGSWIFFGVISTLFNVL
jgi:hypothetical protein